ncbi:MULTISPECIES: multidrug/spermidine efflux SMR transporter subunit MdtJ [Vitreoscilla]|uniref:Spermidine export protein MdtJ n=1 Tax=Vitreoscilla stercoraria TaxID=61 RepID=A0ABY4EEK1_VITST|nr:MULTISPECIES: multidrug/spermidine efflux SMR transporter subunit MdtJ [Vitreoscilla]AUZ04024.1 spermidine export protein MdtJ [Vitreoscilla sp. C1]UOO93123.1 SMR family transporter [Vitreoscilla stercoraria]
MIYWIFLGFSIVMEVAGVLLMQYAANHNSSWGMALMYGLICASYMLLSVAVKRIPLGVAYALWEGVGIVCITVLSVFLFGESMSILKIVGLGLLMLAILLLKSGTSPKNPSLETETALDLSLKHSLKEA